MTKYPSTTVYKDIMGRIAVPPAVSILLPVHPVFGARGKLQHRLKVAMENVRHQLSQNYSAGIVDIIMTKLEGLRKQFPDELHDKSVALFASPQKSIGPTAWTRLSARSSSRAEMSISLTRVHSASTSGLRWCGIIRKLRTPDHGVRQDKGYCVVYAFGFEELFKRSTFAVKACSWLTALSL